MIGCCEVKGSLIDHCEVKGHLIDHCEVKGSSIDHCEVKGHLIDHCEVKGHLIDRKMINHSIDQLGTTHLIHNSARHHKTTPHPLPHHQIHPPTHNSLCQACSSLYPQTNKEEAS